MAGESCNASAVDQALGITAGVLLAICLMPQLWKMYSTKSARDISYGWTAFYFLGLIFYFAYLFRIGALVGWIGILVEAVLVVLLVIGKFYLENVYIKRHPELQRPSKTTATEQQHGSKDVDEMELQRTSLAPNGQASPREGSLTWLPHHPHVVTTAERNSSSRQ